MEPQPERYAAPRDEEPRHETDGAVEELRVVAPMHVRQPLEQQAGHGRRGDDRARKQSRPLADRVRPDERSRRLTVQPMRPHPDDDEPDHRSESMQEMEDR